MGLLVGIGEIAHRPVDRRLPGLKGEGHGPAVPLLELHSGEIHAAGIDPGRGAGLEPPEGQAHIHQAVRQRPGGEHTVRPPLPDALAHNGPAIEVRPGAHDGGLDGEHGPGLQDHMADRAVREADLRHLALPHHQVLLPLQGVLHHLLIMPPVRLGPQAVDRRALPPVQ